LPDSGRLVLDSASLVGWSLLKQHEECHVRLELDLGTMGTRSLWSAVMSDWN
jgi:hypothetical protein